MLIAVVYAVSLRLHRLAALRAIASRGCTDVHFAIDVVMVSACVALTGGVTQPLHFAVCAADRGGQHVQFRRGALQVAALSSLLYAGIVLAQYAADHRLLGPMIGIRSAATCRAECDAVHGRAERLRPVRGRLSLRLAGRTRAPRRRAAGTDVRRDGRSAVLQSVRHRQPLSGLATADGENRLLTFNRSAVQITGHSIAERRSSRAPARSCSCRMGSRDQLDEDLQRARSKRPIAVPPDRRPRHHSWPERGAAAVARRPPRLSLHVPGRNRRAPAGARSADAEAAGGRRRDGGRHRARDSQSAGVDVRIDADSPAGAARCRATRRS